MPACLPALLSPFTLIGPSSAILASENNHYNALTSTFSTQFLLINIQFYQGWY